MVTNDFLLFQISVNLRALAELNQEMHYSNLPEKVWLFAHVMYNTLIPLLRLDIPMEEQVSFETCDLLEVLKVANAHKNTQVPKDVLHYTNRHKNAIKHFYDVDDIKNTTYVDIYVIIIKLSNMIASWLGVEQLPCNVPLTVGREHSEPIQCIPS